MLELLMALLIGLAIGLVIGTMFINKGYRPDNEDPAEEKYIIICDPESEWKARELTCPHCGKVGKGLAMKRWHFNNCKKKEGDK